MAARKTAKPQKPDIVASEQLRRRHQESFRLNDLEYSALMKYLKKYKVASKSKFLREAVMTAVLKRFDDDYPTLFDVQEQAPDSAND